MPSITLEQALVVRPERQTPRVAARSPGFADAWFAEAEALAVDFGPRPRESFHCPPNTIFAKPLTDRHVAIVRVRDEGTDAPNPRGLQFHILVISKRDYETWVRDPFLLCATVPATWDGEALPSIAIAAESFVPRTVAQVQSVLKRVKISTLKKGEDPNAPDFERTVHNSQSPTLLGGAQILVDGGRLIFERLDGDHAMISGLWLLLPEGTRSRLWPTTFAFSSDLDLDVLVLPHVEETMTDGYSTETQAAEYPAGSYELALQTAAEAGDQKELEAVFNRRDSRQTIRLALILLAALSLIVITSRLMDWSPPPPPPDSQVSKAAAAAGVVFVGDPWTASGMLIYGDMLWGKKK